MGNVVPRRCSRWPLTIPACWEIGGGVRNPRCCHRQNHGLRDSLGGVGLDFGHNASHRYYDRAHTALTRGVCCRLGQCVANGRYGAAGVRNECCTKHVPCPLTPGNVFVRQLLAAAGILEAAVFHSGAVPRIGGWGWARCFPRTFHFWRLSAERGMAARGESFTSPRTMFSSDPRLSDCFRTPLKWP